MSKEVLITGVRGEQQMNQAKVILETKIIPQENAFQKRKKNGSLSNELIRALKANA